jgi:hypothetical protein
MVINSYSRSRYAPGGPSGYGIGNKISGYLYGNDGGSRKSLRKKKSVSRKSLRKKKSVSRKSLRKKKSVSRKKTVSRKSRRRKKSKSSHQNN